MIDKRQIGRNYEQVAVEYLKAKGYRILTCNFQSRNGEIDIVAEDGDVLCFIEVKYRSSRSYGTPFEAITPGKQRSLCRSARYYMLRYQIPETRACRFDCVGITGSSVELIRNAFEFAWA